MRSARALECLLGLVVLDVTMSVDLLVDVMMLRAGMPGDVVAFVMLGQLGTALWVAVRLTRQGQGVGVARVLPRRGGIARPPQPGISPVGQLENQD